MKAEFRQTFAGIDTDLANIKGFAELKQSLDKTTAAYRAAGQKAKDFARQIKDGTGGGAAIAGFGRAQQAAASLKEKLGKQTLELKGLDAALTKAGISTSDLGAAQAKLEAKVAATKEEYKKLSAVAKARDSLGLNAHKNIQAAIDRTRAAYETLKNSGKLTSKELAQANLAMSRQLDELKAKTNGWSEALIASKEHLIKVGVAAAALISASKVAIRFEGAMADVRKTVSASDDEIEKLSLQIRQMSHEIPVAADELAGIAAAGGQLGIAAKDISQFTEVAAKMSTAFDMTAEEAGNSIGKLKNVFSLTIPEVEGLGDSINQLGNNTAARERDIVNVMLRIGGTSKNFGIADKNAAALAATMLALGRPAEVAGTSINSMLSRMQTATMQSADFQTALKKIGMNAQEMAAQVAANPQRALDTLLDTLSKLDGQKRAEVLTGLFGKEFQDDLGILVGSLGTYRDAMGQVADETAYAGAMNKEFLAKIDNDPDKGLQLLRNVVVDITRSIGEGFLPVIRTGASALTAILKPIAAISAEFPKTTALMATFGAGLFVFRSLQKLADIARLALARIGPTAAGSFAQAATSAATLNSTLAQTGAKADQLPGKVGRVSNAFSALAGIGMAWGGGQMIGDILNQFDFVRKGAASLIYSLDRVRLGAVKMWRALTGGDSGEVDKQIENAKQAYSDLMNDIETGQDDWSKKQRGETPGAIGKEKVLLKTPEEIEDERKAAEEKARLEEEKRKQLEDKADAGRDREQQINEGLSDNREKRQEKAAEEDLARRKRLDAISAKTEDNRAERKAILDEQQAGKDNTLDNRLAAINAEASAAKASHQDTLTQIKAEAEERQKEAEERQADIKAELKELKAAHEEKLQLYADEAEALQQAGDEKGAKEAEKKSAREEKSYAKETERLGKESVKLTQDEAEAKIADDKKVADAERDYNAETNQLNAKAKQDVADEQARRDEAQRRAQQESSTISSDTSDSSVDSTDASADKEYSRKRRKPRRASPVREDYQDESAKKEALIASTKDTETVIEESTDRISKLQKDAADEQIDQIDKVADAQQKAAEQRVEQEKQTTEKMQSSFKSYAEKVKSLAEDMSNRNKTLAEELIDLDPTASEEQKWKKRAALASGYAKQAKAAMAAGNLDEALKLSDQSSAAYKALKGGGEGVDTKMAANMAYRGVKDAGAVSAAIESLMAQQIKKEVTFDMGTAGAAIAKVAGQLSTKADAQKQQPGKVVELKFAGGALHGDEDSVKALLDQLEKAGMAA